MIHVRDDHVLVVQETVVTEYLVHQILVTIQLTRVSILQIIINVPRTHVQKHTIIVVMALNL